MEHVLHVRNSLCVPLAKSGWPEGRINMDKGGWWLYWQDSEAIQRAGAKIVQAHKALKVLLTSSFIPAESTKPDIAWMGEAAHRYGLEADQIVTKTRGHDTKSQLAYAMKYALANNFDEMQVISSWLHWPRVKWLCFRMQKGFPWLPPTQPPNKLIIVNRGVWGIPRPREIIIDLAGIFLYIPLDFIGRGYVLENMVKKKRDDGKL